MKYVLIASLMLASVATTAMAEEKTYTLTVTQGDLAIIAEGVGELPYNKVSAMVAKLSQQYKQQIQPTTLPDVAIPPKP